MSTKQNLTDLTICRAVFAAWVFIYHVDLYLNFSRFLGPLANWVRHGYLGVDGFFMLSGLILARVHTELLGDTAAYIEGGRPQAFQLPSVNLICRFWGKRLARLYPVHLASIIILAVLVGLGMFHGWTPNHPSRFDASSLVQNLLLVQGWGGSPHGSWNYPSWSVSTEWAGYLVFPILWYLIGYFGSLVAFQIVLVGFTSIGLVFVLNGYNLNLTFADGWYRFFPEFIMGMASARTVHIWADYTPVRRTFFVAGILLAVIGAAAGVDLLALVGIWLILYMFVMQNDAELPAVLGWRPVLDWFGRRSYAFYMTFAIAELLMSQYFQRHGWTPASHSLSFAVGMVVITLALAVTLYALVETPCRRLGDRWFAPPVVEKNPKLRPKYSVKG
jgi:peptidoglycan/LPS O-acetylase OafA/YrhL